MSRGSAAGLALAGCIVAFGLTISAGAHDEDWRKIRDRMPPFVGPMMTLSDFELARASGAAEPDAEFESENITMLAWVPISEFPGGHDGGNNCWGYTSPSGREYAIMGLEKGYGFVEITDPANPVILDVIAGPASLWHDIRVMGEYAYGVSEAGRGIQVIDLTRIDEGLVRHVVDKTQLGHSSTHTIISNPDSGYLYLCGTNTASGGLTAVDVSTPEDPTIVGAWPDFYVHEAQVVSYIDGPYAGREIAFCLGGRFGGWSDTGLRIVDVTDKTNMFTISDAFWSASGYAHQGWTSEDRRYFYINDELDEEQGKVATTTTRIFDISDLSDPKFVGTFTTGLPSTDHNLYVKGNLIFESNYRSGLRVFDATDPVAPVEVAWIDTHPESDASGYSGAWGNFPFFDSGTVIISDMVRGLFVVRVDSMCRADLDGDGDLTFFDFLMFQNLFSAGDPKADFDGDGDLTFFDFLVFQDEFAAGCP
jgi:choice-of-anchor B domain-containing protein